MIHLQTSHDSYDDYVNYLAEEIRTELNKRAHNFNSFKVRKIKKTYPRVSCYDLNTVDMKVQTVEPLELVARILNLLEKGVQE